MALLSGQAPNITGSAITYSTPTTTDTAVPGNNVYWHVKTVGTAVTATVVVPGSAYGQARPDVAVAIGTNTDRIIGPLTADLADPTTGFVNLNLSATTAVTVALLQLGG
jgi:hypothetical protein